MEGLEAACAVANAAQHSFHEKTVPFQSPPSQKPISRERDREKERERQRERQIDRQSERESDTDIDSDLERELEREADEGMETGISLRVFSSNETERDREQRAGASAPPLPPVPLSQSHFQTHNHTHSLSVSSSSAAVSPSSKPVLQRQGSASSAASNGSSSIRSHVGVSRDTDRDRERERDHSRRAANGSNGSTPSSMSKSKVASNKSNRASFSQAQAHSYDEGVGENPMHLPDDDQQQDGGRYYEVGSFESTDSTFKDDDIANRMRRMSQPESYETVAMSLATINPMLASRAERLKMRLRIVYKDSTKPSETVDITPQELLIELMNSVRDIQIQAASAAASGTRLVRRPSRGTNLHHTVSIPAADGLSPKQSPIPPVAATNRDKRDFIQDVRSRDIRRLETRYSTTYESGSGSNEQNPYILIRKHCVILCLGSFIRAIIQSNRFLLIVQQNHIGNEEMLDHLEENIKELLKSNSVASNFTEDALPSNANDSTIKSSVDLETQLGIHPSTHVPFSLPNQDPIAAGTATDSTTTNQQPLLAYEIQIYEALMTVVVSLLRRQYEDCSIAGNEVLNAIGKNSLLSIRLQEQMRILRDQIRELSSRCSGFCKLLTDILQSDEDEFAFLYLTELFHDPKLYQLPICDGSKVLFSRCSDIETVFDSLLMDFESLEKASQTLLKKLESAETSVGLRLDASRNELLVATTIISIISSTIGFAGFVTGAFGMNLDNTAKFDTMDGFFACIVVFCLLFIALGSTCVIAYFELEGWIPIENHLVLGAARQCRKYFFGRSARARGLSQDTFVVDQKEVTLNPLIQRHT